MECEIYNSNEGMRITERPTRSQRERGVTGSVNAGEGRRKRWQDCNETSKLSTSVVRDWARREWWGQQQTAGRGELVTTTTR